MRAVVVTVARSHVEIASDALWRLGAVAVEERTVDGGADTVELWTALGDDATVRGALATLDGGWNDEWAVRFEDVDESVSETWRDYATDIDIEPGLVIVPAWRPAPAAGRRPGVHYIEIDPGATFGMGDHPTTQLSLRALRRIVRSGDRVLDAGCGSGVLGIAAALFGATAVHALDISPAAVACTHDNARRNGVLDRIHVELGWPELREMRPTDIVVANILAPALIEYADHLRAATGRRLIISGLLADRFDHVVDALAPLEVEQVDEMDGWVAVTLCRGTAP